jgi:putative FmdB family regulatory protein
MPLYDYRCHRCGATYEVRQKFSDPLLTVHEGCGGEVERLISAPALQFKGTGWYVTDYARNGKTSSASSAAKSEAQSETKTESKGETGGESKSEPAKAPGKVDVTPSSSSQPATT